MTTKVREPVRTVCDYTSNNDYVYNITYSSGRESISYPSGPRLPSGHWPWRECEHKLDNVYNGRYALQCSYLCENYSGATKLFKRGLSWSRTPDTLGTDPGWNRSVVNGIMDQLDLNKGESCLMYANVVQALPFLGAATKLSSILNNAARQFRRNLNKMPFTTAVKTLIQADFVDRFVISPTIDDARKFANATNYVANKLATAEERNSSRFALEAESETVYSLREGTSSWREGSSDIYQSGNYDWRFRTRSVDKAFVLLEATYATDALTPFRLWANRTGFSKPLDSAWDLVPFSFVIDYFFRAGDFISGLSEEMASDEGLRGTITKVHGMWGSHLYESTYETRARDFKFSNPGWNWPITKWHTYTYGKSVFARSIYRRFPISNPYSLLLPFEEKLSDYLTVNLDLSSTRKRTIAELVIQAKL